MVCLNFVGSGLAVDPAVYGGEGNPKLLGEFFLRDFVFQAVLFQARYQVFHVSLHSIARSLLSPRLFASEVSQLQGPELFQHLLNGLNARVVAIGWRQSRQVFS